MKLQDIPMHMILLLLPILAFSSENSYYYQNGKKIYLTPTEVTQDNTADNTSSLIRSTPDTESPKLYYTNPQGQTLGVTNRIILKFTEDADIQAIFSAYKLTLHKDLKNNMYSVITQSAEGVVDLSNALYELPEVEYAHPDFYIQLKRR